MPAIVSCSRDSWLSLNNCRSKQLGRVESPALHLDVDVHLHLTLVDSFAVCWGLFVKGRTYRLSLSQTLMNKLQRFGIEMLIICQWQLRMLVQISGYQHVVILIFGQRQTKSMKHDTHTALCSIQSNMAANRIIFQ